MKTKILLIGSFGLNVALFAAYWAGTKQSMDKPVAAEEVTVAKAEPEKKFRLPRIKETVNVAQAGDFHWAEVESQDYREYIANLREISCPEETVRDIIIADINKLYAGKIAALYPSPKDFKYWRVEDRSARDEERELESKRRELEREKRNLIKELLGIDYDAELARASGRPDEDAWRYGFLSPEKQEQVRELGEKFREMERSLWGEGGGWNAENRAKFAALRAQREAELAAILGPEEFQQYQLRNSWTARSMREDLASFSPNEEEFRKIFDIRKGFDDQFGFTREGSDEAAREQRRLAQQQLEEQLKTLLGADRFREYQLAQDERFRDVYDFTQRANLSRQTAETVYDVRRAAEDERRRIENDQSLSADARAGALAGLSTTTKQALEQALGPIAWNDYQRRTSWFDRLGRPDSYSSDGRRYRR